MARSVPPGPAVSAGGRKPEDQPVRAFRSSGAWDAWLAEHHASSDGLWLKFAKMDSGVASVTHAEALCEKASALIDAGVMKPAGLREVQRAKDDGRWDAAYDPQRTASVPEDLERELELDQRAREFFASLDSHNRYAVLHRIHDAKRPETRARRIATYVRMLSEHRKIYP